MLDFEKVIAERTKVDCKKFVRSGHFLFLHSRMLERWKILNENNTYPEMIKPLKI